MGKEKIDRASSSSSSTILTSHTTPAQYLAMVEWLRIPENYKLITGSAAQGKADFAGQKLKKKDAHVALAKFIYERFKVPWDFDTARNRYEGYVKRYKKAKKVRG